MKGLVIAGTKSGSGKTTVTLGIMAALARRGLKVAPFKVGPDFIDPGHHTRISGSCSRNIDGWMLSKAYNLACFQQHSKAADIAVVEGVMGLFDGYDGSSEAGSTAQMAKWLDLAVLLVVDAKSMARSAAALVQGFERFDPQLRLAGVLFNNLGSPGHLVYLRQAMAAHVNTPCLGGLIRDPDISIPERHLGLVTREDHNLSEKDTTRLADCIEKSVNLDDLLNRLPQRSNPAPVQKTAVVPNGAVVRIGVARDQAFCFYYQDNLDLLEAMGAQLIYFSPVTDPALPLDIDGIYLGGGYPELHAQSLSANVSLRRQIKEGCQQGMPIYGECGGFMYLCRDIRSNDGTIYPMAGCFAISTEMSTRLKSLGYREVTLNVDTVIGRSGQVMRGHEFHYSEISAIREEIATAYAVSARTGLHRPPEGYQTGRCLGSYVHLHFGSQPAAAERFIQVCQHYQRERKRDL